MAITQRTQHIVRLLVGDAGGVEFGFQEKVPGTVGACTNRSSAAGGKLPIPQEIVELNNISTEGVMWAKFRDVRLDTAQPGTDIPGVTSIDVTISTTGGCTPTQATMNLIQDVGIKYEGTNTAVRDILIANAGSTVKYEINYNLA